MMRGIDEGPKGTRRCSILRFSVQETGADAEQEPAAKLQTFGYRIAPHEGFQQRQPGIFELRQLFAGDAAP